LICNLSIEGWGKGGRKAFDKKTYAKNFPLMVSWANKG